jgi:hypothetical protein
MVHPLNSLLRIVVLAAGLALGVAAQAAAVPGPEVSATVDLSAYRTVLHVDQARGDDVKGEGSREKPFATITHALEMAGRPTAQARVAILVSQGRYAEATFALKPNVDLYGGFAAPGGARDIYAHPSHLDGAEQNRIAIGADHARVDGFHFENGRVRGKGAALLCDGVSPVVTNCVFTNNRTLMPSPWAPPLLHETANDGGAIMCLNGAAPRLEHNLFYANTTECGRGGAVASDRAAAPLVRANVFANNWAGLNDPMRSSDGGAVSFFRWSAGEFTGNVVVANASLTRNDAGGLWVALWSAPRIADNVFVANEGGDDAGALFIGGQEHRYGVPLDPYPAADKFNVLVERNLFVGNTNSSKNSGAMRVTMESRVRFANNIIAENEGGFYLQRSEITAEHNTVWQDWCFVEDKASLGPSRFDGNILKGPAGKVEARVTLTGNMTAPDVPGTGRVDVADIFENDEVTGELVELHYDAATMTTVLTTKEPLPAGVDFTRRPVTFADSLLKKNGAAGGQWRVIAHASGNQIVVWGRIDPVTKVPKHFKVLRTFTVKAGAPAGIGASLK